jgi:hypothetical protein
MARAKAETSLPAADAATPAKDYAEITYVPLNRDDPHTVTWAGIEFRAHLPRRVSLKATYLVPTRVEHVMADGTVTTKHVEKPQSLIELARSNPSFTVDGVGSKQKAGTARTPQDAKEYRGYCTRWIAASTDPAEMDTRWAAEEALRDHCGCDGMDVEYLRPFFEAQKDVLSDRAKIIETEKRAKRDTNAMVVG